MVAWQGLRLTGDRLAAARGGRDLFTGVGFALKSGEALMVAGANGAGKTTLMRALCGLGRFDAGTVLLKGGETGREIGEQTHYVGHQDAIKPQLTAQENLAFWASYLGRTSPEQGGKRAYFAVCPGDVLADVPAQFLSAGQKRKLALARLTLAPRPVWILDEPAVSLDEDARAALTRLMKAHLADGGMIVAASHTPLGIKPAATLTLGGTP